MSLRTNSVRAGRNSYTPNNPVLACAQVPQRDPTRPIPFPRRTYAAGEKKDRWISLASNGPSASGREQAGRGWATPPSLER